MSQLKESSPWSSLLILLGITFACSFGTQMFVILGFVISSGNLSDINDQMLNIMNGKPSGFLYLILLTGSVGTFLIPSMILQYIERPYSNYFPINNKKILTFAFLIFIFLFALNPVMEVVSEWNLKMKLPESISSLESWMYQKEEEMKDLTENIVMVDSVKLLFANLLVMALVPAVVEEFYFRGSLQNICNRIFKNTHAAIWITAIIFSLIHLQFYGFFPRMILGVIFGYSLYWSGNIWVPVIGHFINNATVTLLGFYYHQQGKTFDDLQQASLTDWYFIIPSIIFSIAIGLYFYKIRNKNEYVES